MAWWQDHLLPSLKQPSLIILDNASYHRARPASTPDPGTMTKEQLVAALKERGVPVDSVFEYKKSLELKLRQWIVENVRAEVEQLAGAAGHTVLWLLLLFRAEINTTQ